jgi:hypothetical protein
MKCLQIYIMAILFVFLASYKGQNQTAQLNKNISQKEIVILDT